MKMTILITMAGLGTRFREAGYTVPKYQIEAKGKTLFAWSMESLAGFQDPETSRRESPQRGTPYLGYK